MVKVNMLINDDRTLHVHVKARKHRTKLVLAGTLDVGEKRYGREMARECCPEKASPVLLLLSD